MYLLEVAPHWSQLSESSPHQHASCGPPACCYIAAHGVTDDSDWEYEIARIVLIAALSAV